MSIVNILCYIDMGEGCYLAFQGTNQIFVFDYNLRLIYNLYNRKNTGPKPKINNVLFLYVSNYTTTVCVLVYQ